MRTIPRAILAFFFLLGGMGGAAPQDGSAPALDLSTAEAVIDLGSPVPLQGAKDPTDPSGIWLTIAVQNLSTIPVTRVLAAEDSPGAGLSLFPLMSRPALVGAASSEAEIILERSTAFGSNAFRIVVPPMRSTLLALRYAGDEGQPSVQAWNESALIAHNRQTAALKGLVTGLLMAAAAFAAGAALLSQRLFCRWAALFLAALLLCDLTAAGAFDDTLLTALSGPYALFALFLAVSIAAAIRLIDYIASFDAFYPGAAVWRDRVAVGVVCVGVTAFAGVPLAGLLVRVVAVLLAAAAAGYLAHCGRLGIAGARRLAPAATIFALVTAAATFHAFGVFGVNLVASSAIGGFSAAGALLVALATAVQIEPAMERLRQFREAHRHDDVQATLTDEVFEQQRELAAVSASHQGVFDLDMHTGLLSLSSEAATMLGLPPGAVELNQDAWLDRIHRDDCRVYEQAMEMFRHQPGMAFRVEFRARGAGEHDAWFELRATMTGQATEAERCLGLIADVTARKNLEAAAPRPGLTDPLTGLGTRAALVLRIEASSESENIALAVFDLDRFKAVNDSLGRDGADKTLQMFADRFESSFAQYEGRVALFRLGGDMFATLALDVESADAFGRGILELASTPFSVMGREIYLDISVGVATGAEAEDAQDLVVRAERAMADAKREGGGRVRVYSGVGRRMPSSDPLALETDLRHAIERGEIEVHYQPIVRLKDGTVAGFEALMRWRHPKRGMIEPENFVPQAEKSGLIVPMGRLALHRAAQDLKYWQTEFPAKPPLFVSVNVAWRQIADGAFASEIAALLKQSLLPKRSFKLEVTESAVMAGADGAETALKRLKNLGIGLAIDDFGTGHSSLAHLRRFPFEAIKIDRSFLVDAQEGPGAAILSSIVTLAHELKLLVVAEGIESESDAELLRGMQCEFGQGYLFGLPASAGDITNFMASLRPREIAVQSK